MLRDEAIRQRVLDVIAALNIETPWQVTIQPYKRNRSLEQNNLYWMWLGIVALETGHVMEEIHEFCKCKFLPPVFVEIAGETHETRRSTTKLKVDEMTAYLDAVHAWATSDLGLLLPVPDDRSAA